MEEILQNGFSLIAAAIFCYGNNPNTPFTHTFWDFEQNITSDKRNPWKYKRKS